MNANKHDAINKAVAAINRPNRTLAAYMIANYRLSEWGCIVVKMEAAAELITLLAADRIYPYPIVEGLDDTLILGIRLD